MENYTKFDLSTCEGRKTFTNHLYPDSRCKGECVCALHQFFENPDEVLEAYDEYFMKGDDKNDFWRLNQFLSMVTRTFNVLEMPSDTRLMGYFKELILNLCNTNLFDNPAVFSGQSAFGIYSIEINVVKFQTQEASVSLIHKHTPKVIDLYGKPAKN